MNTSSDAQLVCACTLWPTMNNMMKFLLLCLFLREFFLISSGEGVTYCVKPTPTGSCLSHDCQQCETLQYYFDSVDKTINQQNNVTLLFVTGSHMVYINRTVTIRAQSVSMAGINNAAIIILCLLYLDHRWDSSTMSVL